MQAVQTTDAVDPSLTGEVCISSSSRIMFSRKKKYFKQEKRETAHNIK